MKRWLIFLGAGFCLVLFSGCAQQIRLFNGYNLDGWKPYLGDSDVDPSRVWTVRNGRIRCEGVPHGYLRTTRTYENYKLSLEWRWPEEPTNSGILLHMTGEDQIWPRSIEAQLRSGDAGDLILIGEDVSLTVDGRVLKPEDSRFLRIPRTQPSSEKRPGQWNRYEIVCMNGSIELKINGVVQNTGTNASLRSGYICLQSEGSPIEFRNIILQPLP